MKLIKAKDARKAVLDRQREASDLSNEALKVLEKDLNEKIQLAIGFGELQTDLSLQPINRLNNINIEGAKRAIVTFGDALSTLGYKFDPITNHTTIVTICWD